jgi:formyltetrahydrofolate synthetase
MRASGIFQKLHHDVQVAVRRPPIEPWTTLGLLIFAEGGGLARVETIERVSVADVLGDGSLTATCVQR